MVRICFQCPSEVITFLFQKWITQPPASSGSKSKLLVRQKIQQNNLAWTRFLPSLRNSNLPLELSCHNKLKNLLRRCKSLDMNLLLFVITSDRSFEILIQSCFAANLFQNLCKSLKMMIS